MTTYEWDTKNKKGNLMKLRSQYIFLFWDKAKSKAGIRRTIRSTGSSIIGDRTSSSKRKFAVRTL